MGPSTVWLPAFLKKTLPNNTFLTFFFLAQYVFIIANTLLPLYSMLGGPLQRDHDF